MTQEERELLLKDLCARLPYGVAVQVETPYSTFDMNGQFDMSNVQSEFENVTLNIDNFSTIINNLEGIECIKPYLRPMDDMTEEERHEYNTIAMHTIVTSKGFVHIEATDLIDWLNARHFDYRALIERDLAIEVTEENNPYENDI